MLKLTFDQGSILLHGLEPQQPGTPIPLLLSLPGWKYDPRVHAWRAQALAYRDALTALHRSGLPYQDDARRYETLELKHLAAKAPHPFQQEGLEAWKKAGRRGIVILPTGAGKSYLAELAIEDAGRSALVVTPTLDLLNQWYDNLVSAFGPLVGALGGGFHELRSITVTTYDSMVLYLDRYGDRFGLLIFDECHHLPAPSTSNAAECSLAPFRLGLTATLERPDGGHRRLDELVGPVIYRREIRELAGAFLAEYQTQRLEVDLSDEEYAQYAEARALFREFLSEMKISFAAPDGFRRFIMLSSRSEQGRVAFRAYRLSRTLALAAPAKLLVLERLMVRHRGERMLIFTHENAMVHTLSRRFLIPTITHHTDVKERREILEGFRDGTFPVIATSRVLNEGVNLPSASVGVILSGSGSVREHVQRLGRILRRSGDKQAMLYEVVTRRTLEERVSDRRREHDAYRPPNLSALNDDSET